MSPPINQPFHATTNRHCILCYYVVNNCFYNKCNPPPYPPPGEAQQPTAAAAINLLSVLSALSGHITVFIRAFVANGIGCSF